MIRRPPRSTHCISSAASDVYKRQVSTQSTWDYRLAILPPNFPFASLESPFLTLVSPSFFPGDRSVMPEILHDMALQWFGILVTPTNWTGFWLKEGIATYVERQIKSQLYTKDYAMLDSYLGNKQLYRDMNRFGIGHTFTSLFPTLDLTTSVLPYIEADVAAEKGYQFLYLVDQLIGSTYLQLFLNEKIIDKYRYSTLSDQLFYEELVNFTKKYIPNPDQIIQQFNFTHWLKDTNAPPVIFNFQSQLLTDAQKLANAFVELGGGAKPQSWQAAQTWPLIQKVAFLEYLMDLSDSDDKYVIDSKLMKLIDKCYGFTKSSVPDIIWRILYISINTNSLSYTTLLDTYLASNGRINQILPLYDLLKKIDQAKAISYFCKNKSFYHKYAVTAIGLTCPTSQTN
eukprot:TRINITY_DN2501_c0_g1_i11.p1 TRINITY_DN2501_c0_g1~~TRINITY_DN2501_c0_g1_i11.p1  ORF type:complete len:399 (+),score=67.28 TRINITY_DN2501_c0_g1_i11:144-1340(+)